MGSSPLARGLREDGAQGLDGDRIIPARAGFTSGDRPVLTAAPDHPRSRGVYGSTPLRTNTALGSSPLARGLHRARRPPGRPQRIIPARAGFTRPGIGLSGTRKDHPRSRGVYTPHTLRRTLATGSSPLARGLPSLVGSLADAGRIIPARAGFTGCDAPGSRVPQDHPRSRGVYTGGWLHEMDILGSSPLARGLLPPDPSQGSHVRIIPARAGFTRWPTWWPASLPDHPRSRGVYRSAASFGVR